MEVDLYTTFSLVAAKIELKLTWSKLSNLELLHFKYVGEVMELLPKSYIEYINRSNMKRREKISAISLQ